MDIPSSSTEKIEAERPLTPFALYVHLPFCRKRCAYCDFVSYAGREETIPVYIGWLLEEWQAVKDAFVSPDAPRVTSCYLGGGTPSLLDELQIETLVTGLFPDGVDASMEFTIEVNPESLTPSKLVYYRTLGINRISLGVQSFDEEALRLLGRVHSVTQAEEAIRIIQTGGWENWSIDLMYGLPHQSPGAFSRDLERALSFGSPHLSVYCLTLAPSTPFGKLASEGKLQLPSEREILAMMDILEEKTNGAGFYQYETSNYARPGFPCIHNLVYWHLEPYVGIGLGSVSYFVKDSGPWGAHWENPTDFHAYEEKVKSDAWPFLSRTCLTRREAFMETFLTGLRLTRGIELIRLNARFGKGVVENVMVKIIPLMENGWIELKDGFLRATRRGGRVLDALILEIVSDLD
jgi:oxygen-independent coproporphyrinogen-3 oxidase